MIPVFFSKSYAEYFIKPDNALSCSLCEIDLKDRFILNTFHNRLNNEIKQNSYCINCGAIIKKRSHGALTLVNISNIPDDAIPVLKDAFIDKYTAPASVIGGVIITDKEIEANKKAGIDFDTSKLKLAGRESWANASIGEMPADPQKLESRKDTKLFLENLRRPKNDSRKKKML